MPLDKKPSNRDSCVIENLKIILIGHYIELSDILDSNSSYSAVFNNSYSDNTIITRIRIKMSVASYNHRSEGFGHPQLHRIRIICSSANIPNSRPREFLNLANPNVIQPLRISIFLHKFQNQSKTLGPLFLQSNYQI